jgi:hypothetical protein
MSSMEVMPRFSVQASGALRNSTIASPKRHKVGPFFRRMIHRMQTHLTALKHATTIKDELRSYPKSKL